MLFRPIYPPKSEGAAQFSAAETTERAVFGRRGTSDSESYFDNEASYEVAPRAEQLLIRNFVQEIHTVAVLTTGAASAINFAAKDGHPDPIVNAGTLVSGFSAETSHWPRRLLAEELSKTLVTRFAEFYAAFQAGRIELRHFEFDAAGIGPLRAAPLHVAGLKAAWLEASRRARDLIGLLEEETAPMLADENSGNAVLLAALFDRIIAGEPACCAIDGAIVLPELSERRRAPRQSLLQSAIVRTPAGAFSAFARDISSGGIGMTRMPMVKVGESVAIEIACGRSFQGIVAWCKGEAAGIRFDRPLSPTDPLIFG